MCFFEYIQKNVFLELEIFVLVYFISLDESRSNLLTTYQKYVNVVRIIGTNATYKDVP